MTMSVLRAVENRRTVVRSTNGGITCTIEPDGEITSMLEPFTEGYLTSDVPIYDSTTTLYTRWGDWFAIAAGSLAGIALLLGLGLSLRSRRSPSPQSPPDGHN